MSIFEPGLRDELSGLKDDRETRGTAPAEGRGLSIKRQVRNAARSIHLPTQANQQQAALMEIVPVKNRTRAAERDRPKQSTDGRACHILLEFPDGGL